MFDGLLILTFDGFDFQYVTALDKTTGATVWRKDRNIKYSTPDGDYKKAYATPTIIEVGSRPQLICPSAEATNAFDPATGEELWRVAHGGMNAATRPVYGHGLVFLTSGHSMNLVAVRPGPSEEVNGSRIAWKTNKGVPTRPSQILVGDLLFMVNDAGIATCLEAKTGKQLWQDRLGGKFTASPVCTDGIIYLPDEDGKTHVIEAKSTFKKLAANPLDAGCMASPAISGDEIFIRTKTHLYCIGKK